jgi:Uma2 family endonuclease
MSPTGDRHADIHLAIGSELRLQGERRGHGKAYVEVGVILWKDPFRVVGPDVAFVKHASLPAKTSPEGYLETIPELIVEVRSKNDTKSYLARKVSDYLAAGVQLVWEADPEASTISEHRPGATQKSFGRNDTLQCEDIIPAFYLPLTELFRE